MSVSWGYLFHITVSVLTDSTVLVYDAASQKKGIQKISISTWET